MRIESLALSIALVHLVPAIPSEASSWPQWRGPNRDGSVEGAPWPESFEHLRLSWRVALDKGYPGPIVTEDRVFVAETSGGDTEVVRALDRATGSEIWSVSWPGKGSVPFFARKNGDWIRSTPAFDGDSLYVGGMNEVLVSLDATTGRENWRVDFPKRFGTRVPDFGFASSPLIDGGAVYVQAADSLVKLDGRTGATVWRSLAVDSTMFNSGAFSSPVMAEIGGRRQLVVQARETLHGVDPDNGEHLWSHDVPHYRGMNILTPTVVDDRILTSSYRNQTFLYQLEGGPEGWAAKEVWRYKSPAYMSSPVVVDGHAYLHLQSGRLTCIDLETGEARWTTEPMGDYWSMVVQGDKLLALAEDGMLYLIRATPDRFELLDSRQVSEQPTWAHLAASSDQLFIRELEGISVFLWTQAPSDDSLEISR